MSKQSSNGKPSTSRTHKHLCFAFWSPRNWGTWQLSRPPTPSSTPTPIPSTFQPLTPKDICMHIATPKSLRTRQQQGKALKSPGASRGAAQSFHNIPPGGQEGAVSRFHRVGRVTSSIQSPAKGGALRRGAHRPARQRRTRSGVGPAAPGAYTHRAAANGPAARPVT